MFEKIKIYTAILLALVSGGYLIFAHGLGGLFLAIAIIVATLISG